MVYKANRVGALVISLDFELLWGVRDIYNTNHPYLLRIINERKLVPQLLALFEKFKISATWATVGLMFARNREEIEAFLPNIKPQYAIQRLNPYQDWIGKGEWDDPLHYAHELIRLIASYKGQEIASHTFSHYYCLEKGQTKNSFSADLDSAICMARQHKFELKTIVFPRNQHNPQYDEILVAKGIECYRGNANHPAYQVERRSHRLPHTRLYRLIDSYSNLSGDHLLEWEEIITGSGLGNVAASHYMRPVKKNSALAKLQVKRIMSTMEKAAQKQRIFHLWFHPQDLGLSPMDNLEVLELILQYFQNLNQQYGMISLNMLEASRWARREFHLS